MLRLSAQVVSRSLLVSQFGLVRPSQRERRAGHYRLYLLSLLRTRPPFLCSHRGSLPAPPEAEAPAIGVCLPRVSISLPSSVLCPLSHLPRSLPYLPTNQLNRTQPTLGPPHHLLSLPSGRLLLSLLLGRLPPTTAYSLPGPSRPCRCRCRIAVQYKNPASAREISHSGPQQHSPILSVLSCQPADHPPVTSHPRPPSESTPTPRRPLPHPRLRRRLLAPFRQSAFPPPPSAINPQSTIRIARGRRLRSLAAALALPCWLASSWRTS